MGRVGTLGSLQNNNNTKKRKMSTNIYMLSLLFYVIQFKTGHNNTDGCWALERKIWNVHVHVLMLRSWHGYKLYAKQPQKNWGDDSHILS